MPYWLYRQLSTRKRLIHKFFLVRGSRNIFRQRFPRRAVKLQAPDFKEINFCSFSRQSVKTQAGIGLDVCQASIVHKVIHSFCGQIKKPLWIAWLQSNVKNQINSRLRMKIHSGKHVNLTFAKDQNAHHQIQMANDFSQSKNPPKRPRWDANRQHTRHNPHTYSQKFVSAYFSRRNDDSHRNPAPGFLQNRKPLNLKMKIFILGHGTFSPDTYTGNLTSVNSLLSTKLSTGLWIAWKGLSNRVLSAYF